MRKDLQNKNDEELTTILRNGGADGDEAFTELYNRYSSNVYSYCKFMAADDDLASDIFQEAFIRMYKNVRPTGSSTNVKAYLLKTARNLSINYSRNRKKTVPIEDVNLSYDLENSYEKKELFDLAVMALDLLDYKYKEAFVLQKFDNLSLKEISELTGITVDGVKSRVSRARKKMMEILEPYLKDLCE